MQDAATVLNVLRGNRWRASCWETSPRGSDRGSLEKDPPHGAGTSPAAYRCSGRCLIASLYAGWNINLKLTVDANPGEASRLTSLCVYRKRRVTEYELRSARSNAPSSARIPAGLGWSWGCLR